MAKKRKSRERKKARKRKEIRMVGRDEIDSILEKYEKEKRIRIATICSHSALQIFHGAKMEHIETIGITTPERVELYKSFPNARPDELLVVEDMKHIIDLEEELVKRNAVLIPHGSLVEYVGSRIKRWKVPIFGNRNSLLWEMDKSKMRKWLLESGLALPKRWGEEGLKPPVIVKYHGAKGGMGYKILNELPARKKKEEIIEEFLVGVRFYPHYFYSKLLPGGYKAGHGRIELMGIDRRIETNIDEIYRLNSAGVYPATSFTVVGNLPVVLRESLLVKYLEMGKKVAEKAEELFGGIPGPFCLETIIDEKMNVKVFEISSRIVAGTNIYPMGSPYSDLLFHEPMSMGRRIAREIRIGEEKRKLKEIIY